MTMKKKILTTLSVVLILGLAALGILAYLQDEDSDVNVMTLGNVDIEQNEYERVVENGAYKVENGSYVLKDFTQGKPLLPCTELDANGNPANHGAGDWDTTTVDMSQVGSQGSQKVFTSKNAQDKIVTVKNTGKSDAYVRTWIALEDPFTENRIGINVGSSAYYTQTPWTTVVIDGVTYSVSCFTYNEALKPGEVSTPSLFQVYLNSMATNEDMELLGDTYEILAFSQAVQADGFDSADTALKAAFGTDHPWADATVTTELGITEAGTYNLSGDINTIDTAYFHTQKVKDDVKINGNGATVTGVATSVDAFQWDGGTIPAMSNIFSSADGSKVTVNDITFTGTMSSVMAGHYQNATYNNYDTEFNNVSIIDAEVVSFSAGVSPALTAYGKLVMNNCKVYGTTLSPLDTDPMWPVYDVVAVNYSDVTLKNSKIGSFYMWNQAKVTVANGTTVDSIVVKGNMNPPKYGLTVEAGANVGVIDLTNITDANRINITIKAGATVGKIVDSGVEYADIAAWKAEH